MAVTTVIQLLVPSIIVNKIYYDNIYCTPTSSSRSSSSRLSQYYFPHIIPHTHVILLYYMGTCLGVFIYY